MNITRLIGILCLGTSAFLMALIASDRYRREESAIIKAAGVALFVGACLLSIE
jgi:hypothetical protein